MRVCVGVSVCVYVCVVLVCPCFVVFMWALARKGWLLVRAFAADGTTLLVVRLLSFLFAVRDLVCALVLSRTSTSFCLVALAALFSLHYLAPPSPLLLLSQSFIAALLCALPATPPRCNLPSLPPAGLVHSRAFAIVIQVQRKEQASTVSQTEVKC